MQSNVLGILGEKAATTYFLKRHFVLRDKNYRCRLGEIDIIVQKDNIYHFVEVKTRQKSMKYSNNSYYFTNTPEYFVTKQKQQRFLRTVRYYCFQKGLMNTHIQCDVIAVQYVAQRRIFQIRYFPACFCF